MSKESTVRLLVNRDNSITVQTTISEKLVGIRGQETEFAHGELIAKYDLDPRKLDEAIASARKLWGIQSGRHPIKATVIFG